jgi:hypothetical protein
MGTSTFARPSRRLELYELGQSDREIAAAEGVPRRVISAWRRFNKLSKHADPVRTTRQIKSSDRQALYERGLSDEEIAREQGVSTTSVRCWRQYWGLPVNYAPCRKEEKRRSAERLDLYRKGLGDCAIADLQGVSPSAVKEWRHHYGLSSNNSQKCVVSPERDAGRMLLYQSGLPDGAIAKLHGVHPRAIAWWRGRRGLAANPAGGDRSGGPSMPDQIAVDLLRRIRRALGAALPPDIRDDATSEMYVDLTLGTLDKVDIERKARWYRNRVLDRFASKFGPRSLDQEIGDGEGFTLLDMLADDRSSSWLEEMGATVW